MTYLVWLLNEEYQISMLFIQHRWHNGTVYQEYIDGLVQGRRNSIANALELHLSCTKPSLYAPSAMVPLCTTRLKMFQACQRGLFLNDISCLVIKWGISNINVIHTSSFGSLIVCVYKMTWIYSLSALYFSSPYKIQFLLIYIVWNQ